MLNNTPWFFPCRRLVLRLSAIIMLALLLGACPAPFDTAVVARVTDTGHPALIVTSPVEGDIYTETVVVEGVVTDDLGDQDTEGLIAVSFEVSSTLGVVAIGSVDTIAEDGAFTFSFETVAFDGPLSVAVTATDWNLNTTTLVVTLAEPAFELPSFTVVPGNQNISVHWEPTPGATEYTLRYTNNGFPTSTYGNSQTFTEARTSSNPFIVSNAENGELYIFQLEAELPETTLVSGYEAVMPLSGFTLAPVVTGGYQSISLEWDDIAATDQFEVWRSEIRNGAYANYSGAMTGTSYTDRNVNKGILYYYKVRPVIEGAILSSANSGMSSPFPDSLQTLRPAILLPGASERVAVGDGLALVAAGTEGLHIVDTSDSDNPVHVATYWRTGIDAADVIYRDGYAFVSDQQGVSSTDGEVLVVDLSTPSSPILADSIAINDPGAIAVSDDYTFVVDEEERVRIIYSEDPTNLGATVWTWSRNIDGIGTPTAVDIAAVDGTVYDYLYITDTTGMDPGYGGGDPDFGFVHKVRITDRTHSATPNPYSSVSASWMYQSGSYVPLKVAATDTYVYIFALVPVSTGIVWHSIEVLYASTLNLAGTGASNYETASFSGSEDIFVLGSRVFTADGIGARMWDVSTPTNPISEEFWNTPGFSEGVAVGGNQLYVASNELGLQRIDLTPPPGDFQTEGTYAGTARDLAISGDTAFIATSANTIVSLDISIPGSPQLLDTLALAGPRGLAVSGNHLVVANGLSGVTIVDISDPTSMSELGSTAHIGSVVEVALLGDFAYCAGTGGLQVFNIANTANPVFIGYHDSYSGMNHVVVHGDVAYVTDSGYFEPNVFHILDVSVPGTPVEIDTLYNAVTGSLQLFDLVVTGDYAFFSDEYGGGGTGFVIVDINPDSPDYLTSYSALDTTGIDTAIDVVGNYVFLASNDTTHSLRLLDASDPTSMISASIMESIGWASANPSAVIVRDKYVYVGDINNGLIIIDALPSE